MAVLGQDSLNPTLLHTPDLMLPLVPTRHSSTHPHRVIERSGMSVSILVLSPLSLLYIIPPRLLFLHRPYLPQLFTAALDLLHLQALHM